MQGRWQAHVRRACWMVLLALKASRWFFVVLLSSVCVTTCAQEAPCCGLGSSGPVKTKAANRGPGWTGPAVAVGNGIAFLANKALQRRAAKGRPCSWRGGCRRRACRRLKRTRCRAARPARKSHDKMYTQSNGRFKAEGPGQDSADFFEASNEAAWYSQPSAETDHPAAERTQRWAWTAGKHQKKKNQGVVFDGGLGGG
eukprot:6479908-Amphidinium_carterae.1